MGRNQMASRKTAARGLSDITLLIANATQLKSVMIQGKSNPYYTLVITLIPTSLVLQVVAALVIIVQGALEAKADPSQDDDDDDDWDEILAKWLSELAVFLAFLITVVNVFISAFVNKGL